MVGIGLALALEAAGLLLGQFDPGEVAKALQTGGVILLLLIFLAGFMRKWWVMGWTHADCERERDEWRERAFRGTSLAETAVGAAERILPRRRRQG